MGWMLRRKLSQNADRLANLRAELVQLNEQVAEVAWEADDHELRALMSETPGTDREANEARKHATALERHRDHVRAEIASREVRQDELLDRLAAKQRR